MNLEQVDLSIDALKWGRTMERDPVGKASIKSELEHLKGIRKKIKVQERIDARLQAAIDKEEGEKIMKAMKKAERKKALDYRKMIKSGKIWTVC